MRADSQLGILSASERCFRLVQQRACVVKVSRLLGLCSFLQHRRGSGTETHLGNRVRLSLAGLQPLLLLLFQLQMEAFTLQQGGCSALTTHRRSVDGRHCSYTQPGHIINDEARQFLQEASRVHVVRRQGSHL